MDLRTSLQVHAFLIQNSFALTPMELTQEGQRDPVATTDSQKENLPHAAAAFSRWSSNFPGAQSPKAFLSAFEFSSRWIR